MARQPKTVGGEAAAWEKIQAGLRMAIEGVTEISIRRSDSRWAAIGRLMEKVLAQVGELYLSARAGAVQGSRMQ